MNVSSNPSGQSGNLSAPAYEPEVWNSRVSNADLTAFSQANREVLLRVLASTEYRHPATESDMRMTAHRLDRAPVERTQDALVQFNQAVEHAKGDLDKVAAQFGMTRADVERFEPLARETYLAQGFQDYANCYSYAMNDMDRYRHGGDVPGERGRFDFSSRSDRDYKTFQQELVKAIEADGAMIGGANAQPLEGYYRVAVYTRPPLMDARQQGDAPAMDYHFVRENTDGTWSQKEGAHPQTGSGRVTNRDDAGAVITDPRTAALGRYEFLTYAYVPQGGLDVGPPYEPKTKPGSLDLPVRPEEDWMRRSSDPYTETVSRGTPLRP